MDGAAPSAGLGGIVTRRRNSSDDPGFAQIGAQLRDFMLGVAQMLLACQHQAVGALDRG